MAAADWPVVAVDFADANATQFTAEGRGVRAAKAVHLERTLRARSLRGRGAGNSSKRKRAWRPLQQPQHTHVHT